MALKKNAKTIIYGFVAIIFWIVIGGYANADQKRSEFSHEIKAFSYDIMELFKPLIVKNQKLRIAISELENLSDATKQRNIGISVSEILATNMAQSSFIEIIERGQLEHILKEQKLTLHGLVDAKTAGKVGEILAADAILIGSVSDMEDFFIINIRLVDVEKASVLASASTDIKIKKADLYLEAGMIPKISVREKIQYNLDALDTAIHMYSELNSPEYLRVVWPTELNDLVPELLDRIPDPVKGKWEYDPKTGKIKNSAYLDLKPTLVRLKKDLVYEKVKEAKIRYGLRTIETALKQYYVDNDKYPEKLKYILGMYLEELPDPVHGKWVYNNKTGEVTYEE